MAVFASGDFKGCIAHCASHLAIPGDPHHQSAGAVVGEERRRTKIYAFRECAVLKLIYAALIRAAECSHGIRVSEFEQRQFRTIRDEIYKDFTAQCTGDRRPQSHLSSSLRTRPALRFLRTA